jgi:hypothetical protein
MSEQWAIIRKDFWLLPDVYSLSYDENMKDAAGTRIRVTQDKPKYYRKGKVYMTVLPSSAHHYYYFNENWLTFGEYCNEEEVTDDKNVGKERLERIRLNAQN